MTNDKLKNAKKKYDLEERTAKFGEEIIKFAKKIPRNPINLPLISQLIRTCSLRSQNLDSSLRSEIRAGTSVGANYCEADSAHSKKDFNHKISICKKESRETKHWLRMIVVAIPELKKEARKLWKEAQELNLIFSAIIKKKR